MTAREDRGFAQQCLKHALCPERLPRPSVPRNLRFTFSVLPSVLELRADHVRVSPLAVSLFLMAA